MANQLRLTLLEEREDGTVHGNPGALVALQGEAPADLIAGALQVLGSVDEDGLREAVESARAGKQAAFAPRPGVQ
ncbi:MAG: hypothetical protein WBN01_10790, partial [Polyangiales bacterium]